MDFDFLFEMTLYWETPPRHYNEQSSGSCKVAPCPGIIDPRIFQTYYDRQPIQDSLPNVSLFKNYGPLLCLRRDRLYHKT